MDTFWRIHPIEQKLVGSEQRDVTWKGRELEPGIFRGFKNELDLLESDDLRGATIFKHPRQFAVIKFSGELQGPEEQKVDPANPPVFAVDAFKEEERTPVVEWLRKMQQSSDPKIAEEARVRCAVVDALGDSPRPEDAPTETGTPQRKAPKRRKK